MGNTYPRRAKQLVHNGRAVWLEENSTIKLLDDEPETAPPPASKERILMEETTVFLNNGATPIDLAGDDLLMYQAKQNVKDKKNLKIHVILFLVVFPFIAGLNFTSTTSHGILHNEARNLQARAYHAENQTNVLQEQIPEAAAHNIFTLIDAAHSASNEMHHVASTQGPSNAWYVVFGAYLAWGAWIAYRIVKIIVPNLSRKTGRKLDPVVLEYNRLKSMTVQDLR